MNKIQYTTIPITDDVNSLAGKIVELGILKAKNIDDCRHIAAAVISECDCIISWNFKHIVNIKTVKGVRAITNLEGYRDIEIYSPSSLLQNEEE